MQIKTLLAAGLKRQRGSIIGVGLLMLIVFLSISLALTLSTNAVSYVTDEMARLGFGDTTVWVSGTGLEQLAAEMEALPDVEQAQLQPLIFAGYRLGGEHSDDEGQLLAYDAAQYPYRFLSPDGSAHVEVGEIARGEIYLSPAMQSSYSVNIGDEIRFEMSRSGQEGVFTVAGWFEDPLMGSSMIDMKSFLISAEDYEELAEIIEQTSDFNKLRSLRRWPLARSPRPTASRAARRMSTGRRSGIWCATAECIRTYRTRCRSVRIPRAVTSSRTSTSAR